MKMLVLRGGGPVGGADILCVCVSVFGGLKKIGEVK